MKVTLNLEQTRQLVGTIVTPGPLRDKIRQDLEAESVEIVRTAAGWELDIKLSPERIEELRDRYKAGSFQDLVLKALGLEQEFPADTSTERTPILEETPLESQELEQDLTEWWLKQATDEARATVPKAIEYGSDDLMEMGRTLAQVTGREMTPQECAEFGIYWYVLGKMARWTAAVKDGRPVSDDTILDIGVYTKMVQRIRQEGGWPYKYKENQ